MAQKFTAQAVGRMAELAVEMELLARSWTVGNFNATTKNTAGFDLFAVTCCYVSANTIYRLRRSFTE